jgi:hypothetical protein
MCEKSRAKGAQYCLLCHAELFPPDEKLASTDRSAFILNAENAMKRLRETPLAQIIVSDQLPDGTLPNLKRLVVQPGTFTVMVSQFQGSTILKPGQYECSRLGVGGGTRAAFRAGQEPRPIFFCTVSQTPVTATCVLPDDEILRDETGNRDQFDVNAAVSRLGIRTSDNFLGGAQAQLVLRCVAPAKLLDIFIQARLQSLDPDEKTRLGLPLDRMDRMKIADQNLTRQANLKLELNQDDLATLATGGRQSGPENQVSAPGGIKGLLSYSWAVVSRILWGGGSQVRTTEPVPLSVWDVYRAVRMEFAAAISESVRNEPIAGLYDAVTVRDRIAQDIQRIMSQSFEMYGIRIERVSAFRFICPKYEKLLERRANIAQEDQQLKDREREADIAAKRRNIALGDHIDSSRTETTLGKHEESDNADLARHKIKEDRETEHDRGEFLTEQQQRELARDTTAHRHRLSKEFEQEQQRLQLEADQERQRLQLETDKEKQRLQLQAEKMNMALGWHERLLELQNKQQDATVNRRIKMIEQYAKLPKDSILTIALAENPQLAAAYAASVQAQNQQDKVQMQEKFRNELATAYAGNNAQFTQLLHEAVRQWGHYQTAKQISQQHPQQVINVGLPKPTDGPASGPDTMPEHPSP